MQKSIIPGNFYLRLLGTLLLMALAFPLISGCGHPISTSFDQTSSTAIFDNGLSLTITVGSTTYRSGEKVDINIDEKNSLTTENKVQAANLWPVEGLTTGPSGTLNFPFGLSILTRILQ